MNTDHVNTGANAYEKPSLEVLDIQLEGSILDGSDPKFILDEDKEGEWG